MNPFVPEAILNRRDKMGFITPDEIWIKKEGKAFFHEEMRKAARLPFFRGNKLEKYFDNIVNNRYRYDTTIMNVFTFVRWIKMFRANL
jgi:asparagine synthase (glutamine-hydrolysing)